MLIMITRISTVALLLALTLSSPLETQAFDLASAYQTNHIQGFVVLLNEKVLAHTHSMQLVRNEIDKQVRNFKQVLP
jgi:hypothetical protein